MADSEMAERGKKRQTSDSDSNAEDPDRKRRQTAPLSQPCSPSTSQQTASPERGRKRQASSSDSEDSDSQTGGAMIMLNDEQATGNTQARRLTQNFYNTDEESQKLKNLIVNTEQHMATACPQGYVETLALGELEDELEDSGVCLVLGLPGHGKTALALQAMGRLKASHQFKPVCLTEPKEWKWLPGESEECTNSTQHFKHPHPDKEIPFDTRCEISQLFGNTAGCSDHLRSQDPSQEEQDSRRYVVLLDDVFGKGHYDAAKKKAWEEVFDLVLAKVRAKQVKVILVSRAHIYEECKKSLSGHQLFDDVETIDLRAPKYWTVSHKRAILENFLQEKHVLVDQPIENFIEASMWCTQIGFPQECRFFASDKRAQQQGLVFFSKPLQFLHKQFEQMQENDIRSYLVLILTWLEGGILSSEYLEVDNTETKRRISDLCEQFDVKDVMTIRGVQTKARSLCGVYLSEDKEGNFQFTHQSICDSLVVAMCSFHLKRALDVCSIYQLCEYVRTKNNAVDQSGLSYTVPKSKWPLLAARLVKAMTSEELLIALDHQSLQDEEFVPVFVDNLTAPIVAQILESDLTDLTFHFTSCEESHASITNDSIFPIIPHIVLTRSVVSSLILKQLPDLANHFLKHLPEGDVGKYLKNALVAACYVNDEALVTDLLERGADVTPDVVWAACGCENDDITSLRKVTEKLPWENLDATMGKNLWICCLKGKVNSLNYLLTKARLSECQKSLDQVLTELIRESHPRYKNWRARNGFQRLPELVSALKTAGAKLDKNKVDLWFATGHEIAFPLEEHLAEDSTELSSSLQQNCWTLLHEAAERGSCECLQALMDSQATEKHHLNALDETNRTPLYVAVEKNKVKAVELLLKLGADPKFGTVGPEDNHDYMYLQNDESMEAALGPALGRSTRCPLLTAAAKHYYSAMEVLLLHNARTDITDENKRTPLHLYAANAKGHAMDERYKGQQASEKQRAEELLIAKSLNINQKDAKGSTPLHLALISSQTSLTRTLLSNNVKVDLADNRGWTALHALAYCFALRKSGDEVGKIMETIVETYQNQQTKSDKDAAGKGNESFQDWVSRADKTGRTPLHLAARNGNLTVVKALLKHDANTEIQDKYGWTPLHAAASCCNVEMMDVLIARGAGVDAEDKQKRTPLHIYAEHLADTTNVRLCKQLNPELKAVLNRQNKRGQTALHIAAARGVHVFVGSLLQASARTDLVDSDLRLPLHCLAAVKTDVSVEQMIWYTRSGRRDIDRKMKSLTDKKLVSATPDVNVQDKYGMTPLHVAAEKGSLSLITALLQKDARADLLDNHKRLPIHQMAARKREFFQDQDLRTQTEKELLSVTLDVNVQDEDGKTPLHLAAEKDSLPLITALLENGARADIMDSVQLLPLHWMAACGTQQYEIGDNRTLPEKKLVNATLDINVQDKNGKTYLHLAAEHGNFSLITALLERGVKADYLDNGYRLPLHFMAARATLFGGGMDLHEILASDGGESKPRIQTEKKLVNATPDVNVQDKQGKTPLHLAAERSNFSLITALLEKGAKADDLDSGHRLPLHHMAARETKLEEEQEENLQEMNYGKERKLRIQTEKKLVSATSDINVQDQHGLTPLHLAAAKNLCLITVLLEKRANPVIKDNKQRIPLHHMAARTTNYCKESKLRIQKGKELVSATPDVNVQDKYGKTPLHLAAAKNVHLITVLLGKRADPDIRDNGHRLPLHWMAARRGTLDEDTEFKTLAEEKLVSSTTDVNVQDKKGKTPLHLAADRNDYSLIKTLLGKGATVNAKDNDQRLALHCLAAQETRCFNNGHFTQVWRRLQRTVNVLSFGTNYDGTYVSLAKEHEKPPLRTTVLEKEARAGKNSEYHRFSLHSMDAWKEQYFEGEDLIKQMEKQLLISSCDVNVQDRFGKTPLHLAAEKGSLFLITSLLKMGALTDTKDDDDRLPLHCMAARQTVCNEDEKQRNRTEKKLVSATPEVNEEDKNGKTPLHLAAEHGNFILITALLDKDARADAKDSEHRLPLHCMAARKTRSNENKKLKILTERRLVSATPDVGIQDKHGHTPLQLAKNQENKSLIAALQEKGARADIEGKQDAFQ